jgi:hypothetical protein
MPGKQPRKSGYEIDQHGSLEAPEAAKVHRRAQVEQKPGGDFTVFDILADIRCVHPSRNVPIDIADIVLWLVFAQIGKIDAIAIKEAAVIPLELAIQTADDLPVETLQDPVRRCLAGGG